MLVIIVNKPMADVVEFFDGATVSKDTTDSLDSIMVVASDGNLDLDLDAMEIHQK